MRAMTGWLAAPVGPAKRCQSRLAGDGAFNTFNTGSDCAVIELLPAEGRLAVVCEVVDDGG